MSAFGTKKPGGDLAIQLTFPEVFASTAAKDNFPFAYYPDPATRPVVLQSTNDLQGQYHEMKRREAHARVMNMVRDDKQNEYRATHSHAGYYGMPKPILSQRRYANPSNGNQADIYPARHITWEDHANGLRGGVLFTKEAQKWGRQQLKNRIDQLNAIDVAKQGFQMGQAIGESEVPINMATSTGLPPESTASKIKIELVGYIQALEAAITSGQYNSFAYGDLNKFLRLLFRWASSANVEELKDILEYVNLIEEDILAAEHQREEGMEAGDDFPTNAYFNTIASQITRVAEYLRRMISVVNLSPSERKAASANFIKALGFTSPSTAKTTAEQENMEIARGNRLQEVRDEANFNRWYYDGDDGDEDDDDDGRFTRTTRPSIASSRSRPRFDRNVREAMGARNGAFFGEDIGEGEGGEAESAGRQSFRSGMRPAEMPIGLAIREAEAEREDMTAPTDNSTHSSRVSSRRSATTSSSSSRSGPADAVKVREGYYRPAWLTRATLPNTESGIRALVKRLVDGKYGSYHIQDRSEYGNIRKQIIKKWALD